MRLTTRISATGTAALARFPAAKAKLDDCCHPDGSLDFAKARKALAVEDVMVGSKDDNAILAFTLEYLRQQESVTAHMAASVNALEPAADASVVPASTVHRYASTRDDARLDRNMEKGRIAYVRVDIRHLRDGIHARVSVGNPRGTVGGAEPFAREYAIIAVRILRYLQRSISASAIFVEEGEGAEGLIARSIEEDREQDEQKRLAELAKLRASCDRLRNGYCTPCKFDCPLYCNGKCKDPMKEEV